MTELADEPTVRGPGRPRDASRDRAILAAALQILQEEGYRGLTIDGVAARAGVGRPTIYRRWPSKPALVVAALVEAAELALPVRDTGSLRGDLIAVQRRQVALMNSPESRRVTAGLVADLAA
ncbi:MAG: TetR/AcrR family transcriptional regulator, partial [Actinobacteria bacterium]